MAFSKARHNDFLRVVRACYYSGVRVNIVPRLSRSSVRGAVVDDVEGIPRLYVADVELSRFNMAVKRVFDLIACALLCLRILPLIAVLGLIIKLDSRGPVSTGRNARGAAANPSSIYKLRSMCVLDADQQLCEDPRPERRPLPLVSDYSA